jgi:hypothetical protein
VKVVCGLCASLPRHLLILSRFRPVPFPPPSSCLQAQGHKLRNTKVCKHAVDEYRALYSITEPITRDYVISSWMRTHPSPVGWSATQCNAAAATAGGFGLPMTGGTSR